jgi:hypothetical protein
MHPDVATDREAEVEGRRQVKRITNAADVRNAIGEAHKNGKRTVLMRVKSDGVTTFVAVPIAHA